MNEFVGTMVYRIQIGTYGKIIDYKVCNDIWNEINEETSLDWEYYHKKYKPIWNKFHSEFVSIVVK